jgi:hypothetical protein
VKGHHRIPVIRLGLLSQTGVPTEARAANLSGLAQINPPLEFLDLGFGPRTIARHLPAAQGADDGVGVIDDIGVIEQIKGSQHRVAVLRPEQGLDVPLEAELAALAR